jgi:ABC-type sugar transport system substrate-binding protein
MTTLRTTSLKTTVVRPDRVRGFGAGAAAMAAMAAIMVTSGCDSTAFVPAPPPELKRPLESSFAATYDGPAGSEASPVPVAGKSDGKRPNGSSRIVELILARPPDTDRDYLALALRRELGKARIMFRLTQPDSGAASSPEQVAPAIRAAVGRGVAGLIVEPLEDPAVIDALYDAAGRGVAVLLLDRSVPARDGKTIPRIEYVAVADVGRQIVEDVLEADRSFHRTRPGRVVILHHRSDDPSSERYLASLFGPIKASGRTPEVIAFEGDSARAAEALRKSLEADPNLDILLADDSSGTAAAHQVHVDWVKAGHPEFVFGGYSPYDTRTPELLTRVQAFGNRSVESYAMKTAKTIRSMLDGNAVDELVGIPVTFHRRSKVFVPAAEKTPDLAK